MVLELLELVGAAVLVLEQEQEEVQGQVVVAGLEQMLEALEGQEVQEKEEQDVWKLQEKEELET